MKIIAIVCAVLLGGVFFLSAITKLYPVEPFEYTFVETGIIGWHTSVILARLFIGLELACGALLVANLWLRRFTIPFVLSILMLFNVYLIVQLAKFGNHGNCGCFGDALKFTPLEGILKNIVMMAAAGFVYAYNPGLRFQRIRLLTAVLVLAALVVPFILNPVNMQMAAQHYGGVLNYKIPLEILYTDAKNTPPKVELRKGKWLVAFFSLTCPHCRVAAKKLHVMKMKDPALPIHMVLNGKKENLQAFFDDTHADNISWSQFNGAEKFVMMAGVSLPQIDWVDNSVVVNKSTYFTLDQDQLENWLHGGASH